MACLHAACCFEQSCESGFALRLTKRIEIRRFVLQVRAFPVGRRLTSSRRLLPRLSMRTSSISWSTSTNAAQVALRSSTSSQRNTRRQVLARFHSDLTRRVQHAEAEATNRSAQGDRCYCRRKWERLGSGMLAHSRSASAEAIFGCVAGLLNPGDEAVVLEPAFDIYWAQSQSTQLFLLLNLKLE